MKTNTLLIGPIGSGKSYCTRTLLREWPDANGTLHPGVGLTVLTLALEPGADATNGDCTCEMGFHIHTHLPVAIDIDMMEEWAERLGTMNHDDIAKMSVPISVRQEFNQFMGLYSIARKYVCDRCGEEFCPMNLDDSHAFIIDGLSGLTDMAVQHLIGPKPVLSLGNYMDGQNAILGYLKLALSWKASVVMVAHWSKEINQVTGDRVITIDTLGNKLAPRIGKMFDEIVVTRRTGTSFSWSNNDDEIELKARRLPYSDSIEPSFTTILGRRGDDTVVPLRQRK